jgi:hypothetical protein
MKPKLTLVGAPDDERALRSLWDLFGPEIGRWGIVAHMFYPRDEERRIALEDAMRMQSLVEHLNREEPHAYRPAVKWQEAVIKGAGLSTLIEEGRAPVAQNPAGETIDGASLAAELLLLPMSLKTRFGCSVGIGAACRYVSFFGRSRGFRGLSERKLAEVWRAYSVVSPWWGALRVLNEKVGEVDLGRFVRIADAILVAARAHRAERAREPLLGDDVWFPWRAPTPNLAKIHFETLFDFPADWQAIVFPARAPRRPRPGRLFSPTIVNPRMRFGGD